MSIQVDKIHHENYDEGKKAKQKTEAIGLYPKGQFSKTRYISKEVCRIFAFVTTNAVLVRKIDKS